MILLIYFTPLVIPDPSIMEECKINFYYMQMILSRFPNPKMVCGDGLIS